MAGAASLHAQKIDVNGNGMSDVWEWVFGNGNLDPAADADGDGMSNLRESIAGTNPFDSNSVPKISFAVRSGTNFSVTMPSALGKQYQLQSVPGLDSGSLSNWTIEATLVARTGLVATLSAPASLSAKFFRISISDVDTHTNGMNDWEEYQLGLDPTKKASNGQLDGNGQPMTDYAYATNKLASQNVITITATDPTANQPDPAQSAINLGLFTITRGGFPLNAISVNLGLGGPGSGFATENVDFLGLPRTVNFPVGLSSQTITVLPLANPNLMTPANAMLKVLPGIKYSVGAASNASIVIYPTSTPKGTGLTGQYYTNSSLTYSSSANFNPANLKLTRLDPTVDFTWGTASLPIANNGGYYSVRWTGQVQPQYSETYYFVANTDDGVKLWVNDQLVIDFWTNKLATDLTGSINLQAGTRYNIRMEYFQFRQTNSSVAHLSWYSPDQSKQIIPASRLYPTTVAAAPTAIISPLTAIAFLGQPFTFTVMGANSASLFTANGLPPGLGFNSATGIISGTPSLAGDYQVSISASNAVGVGASVVDIQVLDTGSSVTREIWTGVPGVNISDLPLTTPANITNTLGALEGVTDYGDNYGERLRGYITAPATGNYYFWIAGSDSAELWISNDSEPANKVRRAFVSPTANPAPPPAYGTASRQWNLQPSQKSGWLALVAGQRYYLEVLHKAGVGTNDNFAVAWLQDPTGTNNTPNGVVPGYVLSRYFALPASISPGTLYSANVLPAANVTSSALGSATLRVSADGSQAVLNYKLTGILSSHVDHIDNDPYLNNSIQIMFDISAANPQPDGSFVWNIGPVGTLSAADVREIISEGKAYINIQTPAYPDGEISGHFTQANGTPAFTPPPAPPSWTDDHSSSNAASRFLIQATFGPSPSDIASVQSLGYDSWINNQFALPVSHHLPNVFATVNSDPTTPYPSSLTFNTWWKQSVTAPDQLRQRVAFALSELMVVSENNGSLINNAPALSYYYDTLLDNAFGNFRALLRAVTLTPTMGLYLDMRGNDMGSFITGLHANENYAREIMQLFSVGLYRMWPDGTLIMNSQGNLVPTYDQSVVSGVASVFTGWNYYQANQGNGRLPVNFSPPANYVNPMVLVPAHHELGAKQLLDNVVLPQAWGSQADPASTNFDNYCSQDLEAALDSIFNNQNVGPLVCRELIQRLVTSNPSRDYLYRVVQTFNDDGTGVRGNLQAVIKAILLDYEARSPALITQPTFGKQREPLLRVTASARAFPPAQGGGTYSQTVDQHITITTTNIHRLNNGDTVVLNFTDTSGKPPPTSQAYGVTVTSPTTFTVNAPGLSTGTYGQLGTTISVTNSGHGLLAGNSVYLAFTTGGASNGTYQVVTVPTTSAFTVTASDSATRSGNCLLPKWTAAGYTQSKTNVTISAPLIHGLNIGDSVFINFTSGSPVSGQYQVTAVPDATHFNIIVATSVNQTVNTTTVVYSLVAPPLIRSGNVGLQQSTWSIGYTDGGSPSSSSSLNQTPLRSPTVFNFFFPDYKFPGPLASAGLTTPEFQLTSDTSAALQMNFLEGALLNNTGNTNGLSSYIAGSGAIVLDLGPWMTATLTSNAGVPNLVDGISSLLLGGPISTGARTAIVNYVANTVNLPYSTPPTYTQMRDRVRAVVHLIIDSPDYTVQK